MGAFKLASYPLFRFTGTWGKCSMVAGGGRVPSTRYCPSSPGQAAGCSPCTIVLHSSHPVLEVSMLQELRDWRLGIAPQSCFRTPAQSCLFLVWPRTCRETLVNQGSSIFLNLTSFSPYFPRVFFGHVRLYMNVYTLNMLFVDPFQNNGCRDRHEEDTQMGNMRLLTPGSPKKETS